VSGFPHRGVVEGFYGTPWSHQDRLEMVVRIGRWGMNRYVHAPKSDPLHRERWRDPYPPEALREFGELVERGAEHGVEVGFAISPGLSMEYASRDDRAALARKLGAFHALGARFFGLALDDVPSHLAHEGDRRAFASLAEAHVAVAHELREQLPDSWLWLVPTDYMGVEPTDYLETLGARLDAAIEVGWTGRTLVSPTVRVAEAQQRARTLGRRLLLWDNVPVSDGPMRPLLHLGPYRGREAGLAEHLSGALLNPMEHARASGVVLACAARFLADPSGDEPEAAWEAAIAEHGAGAAEAFRRFAEALRFSALAPAERDRELEAAFAALRDAAATGSGAAAEAQARRALAALLAEREGAGQALRDGLHDRRLADEIEPWLDAHERETRRMARAVRLLDTLAGAATRFAKVIDFLGFEAVMAQPPPAKICYGPRRVLYPQLACLRDDEAAFGPDPALFIDLSLSDEIVRFAEQQAARELGARRAGPATRSGDVGAGPGTLI